jgi:hypothetical protein
MSSSTKWIGERRHELAHGVAVGHRCRHIGPEFAHRLEPTEELLGQGHVVERHGHGRTQFDGKPGVGEMLEQRGQVFVEATEGSAAVLEAAGRGCPGQVHQPTGHGRDGTRPHAKRAVGVDE